MTTSDPTIAEFPYRARWKVLVLCLVMFGSAAAFFGHRAITNERGLVINRVIELGPEGADVFYSAFCAASMLFVIAAVGVGLQRVLRPMRIAFTTEGLIVPHGPLSSVEICIPYLEIFGLRKYRRSSNDFIELIRPTGHYTIIGVRLDSSSVVKAVFEKIVEMCPHLKQG